MAPTVKKQAAKGVGGTKAKATESAFVAPSLTSVSKMISATVEPEAEVSYFF